MNALGRYLLVEPAFPIPKKSRNHKNFLPISLLKIGSYLRLSGTAKKIKLIRGNCVPDFTPNEIWITSLFTYWSEYFWDSVKFYRDTYPDSIIRVGGIYVSLHFDNESFKKNCRKYKLKSHFGLLSEAENCLPDYTLIETNSHPLDYQIIHSTRGCERQCNFCYTWKLEPEQTSKRSIANEVCSNRLVFYDNNLLKNKHIDELLKEIADLKWNGRAVRCESQSGFDGRILEERPELALELKKAKFDNPKIAWDWNYNQWRHIEKQIEVLKRAGYPAKDISVFMIFNWKIPFLEMEKKRLKCLGWKVQITDCRYRPITQLYDNFNARLLQTSKDYYIHPKWTDAEVKQFRRNVRKQNICVRHGFPFHSGLLERKGVAKKVSMELRYLPREKVQKKVPDAWFPNKICKPQKKSVQKSKESQASMGKR